MIKSVLQDADVIARPQLLILRLPILNARQAQIIPHPKRHPVTNAKVPKLLVLKENALTRKKEPLQVIINQTDLIEKNILVR